MSKKTKQMLVLLGVFVLLLAVYGGVRIYNHKQEEQSQKEADIAENGFVVKEMDLDSIVGFSYEHPNSEEFSDKKYTFSKQGETWYYKEDVNFPVNQTVAKTKVEDLAKVYAKRLLEESDANFAEYGLDQPVLSVSVTDGKEVITYHIGNYNESTADYYMNIDGTSQVYTVDGTLWMGFAMELYDMVQMDSFPEIQADHISHLNIKTKQEELDFYFEVTGTQEEASTGKITNVGDWYIVNKDGEKVKASSSKTSALVNVIVGLSYVQEVNYDCKEEQLATYGLDAPGAVITIEYYVDQVDMSTVDQVAVSENVDEIQYETNKVEKQLIVNIGNTTDTFAYTDDYYVKTSDDSSVVTVEAATAEMFLTLQRDNFLAVSQIELP